MTKKLTPIEKLPPEAKQAIALAFKGLGGVPALIRWGRSHRTAFYSLYSKLLPLQVNADTTNVNVNVNVKQEHEQLQKAMVDALTRTIGSARRARDTGGVNEGRVVIIDNDAVVTTVSDCSTGEVIEQRYIGNGNVPVEVRRVTEPQLVERTPEPPPPERSVPRLVNPDADAAGVRVTLAAPPPETAVREPTTTEKFLEYNNNRRGDPWRNNT